jgi:hypothetical protein
MPDLSGPGRIQRVERDQVVESLGLRLAQQFAHTRTLELEDAERGAFLEHLVGLRIVERNVVDVEVDALSPFDFLQRIVDQRERAQPEEVHLQEADPLDLLHVPLGDDFVARPFIEGRVVGDRPGCDDDARGVDRGVTRHPFETLADLDDLLDLGILRDHVLQDRVLGERLFQRHVERRRDLLRDVVHIGVWHVERPSDVTHDSLGLHRPEGDDLRDILTPVLARDVIDHLAAPALTEVDVDVRHRHALGIEEAFEQQVVMDRIDIGDAEAPRDQRSGS